MRASTQIRNPMTFFVPKDVSANLKQNGTQLIGHVSNVTRFVHHIFTVERESVFFRHCFLSVKNFVLDPRLILKEQIRLFLVTVRLAFLELFEVGVDIIEVVDLLLDGAQNFNVAVGDFENLEEVLRGDLNVMTVNAESKHFVGDFSTWKKRVRIENLDRGVFKSKSGSMLMYFTFV